MEKIKDTLEKLFQKGLLHIIIGSFFTKVVSFFGSIFLVRVLSKEHYGILSYLENIYGYVLTIAGMGMSNTILRYVILGKTKQEKYSYYVYARNRGIVCNCMLILGCVFFNIFYPHPAAYEEYTWLLYVLLLSLPFQYIVDNVLCNERAQFSNQRYAIFSLFLTTSIILSKTVFGKLGGITWIVLGQTLTYILLAIGFSILTNKKYFDNVQALTFLLPKRKEMNLYGLQYMVTNGLWSAFMLNDTFLLGRYCSPEVLAEYKVAYTIPGSVSLFSTSIGIFVAPYFVKNEKNRSWIQRNFKKVYLITGMFVGGMCAVIVLLSQPIILLLYGEEYLNILGIMNILLVATFFNCGLRYTTANILAAMGKIKYNMLISVIGMVLQLTINIYIIPHYGSMGAAVTGCFVYCVLAMSLLGIFIKQYYIKN